MKQQIQKLIAQAGTDTSGKWMSVDHAERFAELIVRECAGIALNSGSVTNKSEVAVAEADRIYHKIQEHFGVDA